MMRPATLARLEVVSGVVMVLFAVLTGELGSSFALVLGLGLFMRGRATAAAPPTAADMRLARWSGGALAALACARFLSRYATVVDTSKSAVIVAIVITGLVLLAAVFAWMVGVLTYRVVLAGRGLAPARP